MAVKRSSTTYHHGDLRRELLRQALPLIDEVGLEGFRIRELARRIGVTHGAAYKHFAEKRSLLVAVAMDGFDSFSAALHRAVRQDEPLETRILLVARGYFSWASRNSAAYQVMFGPRLNEDSQYPELEEKIEQAFGVVDEIFLEDGRFSATQSRDYSVALMTLVHGYSEMVRLRRIRVRSRPVAVRYLARLVHPFARGVCADAAS